ncbi:MAG: undecaprenyldiphospho-muramoylpentapeptide beta-N-acetylglucosaminyltransferase [bacterium]|nr:undecaprenyldiphospho-muramoylpentapeptide beta-N-acetylglucosaminyltransferase [bacterium]
MRILFTGGGTGGHFFPIVAVVREIKDIAEEERILDTRFFYIGPETQGEEALEKEGVVLSYISTGKIRNYFSLKNFVDILKIIYGLLQSFWKLFVLMPDVIFSKGGYGSFPILFVARIYRLPVIIHESDIIPGRVNSWSAKFAKRIAVSFTKTAELFPAEKVAVTGNPVRKRLLGGNIDEAREEFKVFTGKPVIFVIGGSQGSQTLNDTLLGVLKEVVGQYEVIHQTGVKNYEDVLLQARLILENKIDDYHIRSFLDEGQLRNAYLLANIIVSRAGAGEIFEIATWGKPSILIPLKDSAQDHQRENAYEYGRAGASIIIEEANLTPRLLLHEINSTLADKERLKRMMEAAQRFARIDGTEVIAREILKLGIH